MNKHGGLFCIFSVLFGHTDLIVTFIASGSSGCKSLGVFFGGF